MNENFDIPDFVEDKTSEEIDMSIFNNNIEEDQPEVVQEATEKKETVKKPRKRRKLKFKLTPKAIFTLAVILLILTSIIGIKGLISKNQEVKKLKEELATVMDEKKALEDELTTLKATPKPTINQDSKSYVITDGPIKFRKTVGYGSQETTYNGKSEASNGEVYDAIAVIKEIDNNYWIKIDNDVYLCIGSESNPWAEAR